MGTHRQCICDIVETVQDTMLLLLTRRLGGVVVSVADRGPRGREFDAHSSCAAVAQ